MTVEHGISHTHTCILNMYDIENYYSTRTLKIAYPAS